MTAALPAGWMRTPELCAHIGFHRTTVQNRWDWIKEGVHFRQGPHTNSHKIWNVAAVEASLRERGYVSRSDLEGGQG